MSIYLTEEEIEDLMELLHDLPVKVYSEGEDYVIEADWGEEDLKAIRQQYQPKGIHWARCCATCDYAKVRNHYRFECTKRSEFTEDPVIVEAGQCCEYYVPNEQAESEY